MRCRSIPFMGTIVYRFWDSFKETVVQRLKAEVVNRAMPSLQNGSLLHLKICSERGGIKAKERFICNLNIFTTVGHMKLRKMKRRLLDQGVSR